MLSKYRGLRYESRVLWEFFKIEFLNWSSNRTRLVTYSLYILFTVLTWGVVAWVVPGESYKESISGVSRNAVDFLLLGQFADLLFFRVKRNISWFAATSEFAHVWMAPPRFATKVIGVNSWRYARLVYEMGIFLGAAILIFSMSFHLGWSFLFVLIGGLVLLQGLEFISAGFTVVTKSEWDPLTWLLVMSSDLLAGTYFPPSLLPGWLRAVSEVHPQRWLLELTRKSLSLGMPVSQLLPEITKLFLFGVPFLFIGYLVFKRGFATARRQGTIGHV